MVKNPLQNSVTYRVADFILRLSIYAAVLTVAGGVIYHACATACGG